MKIKKFHLLRPEIEVESAKPVIGRLYLALNYPRLIKILPGKIKCPLESFGGMAGTVWMKKVYFIAIPKVRWIDKRD